MPVYRLKFLDRTGRVQAFDDLDCASDRDADRRVRTIPYNGVIELWRGEDFVRQFAASGETAFNARPHHSPDSRRF